MRTGRSLPDSPDPNSDVAAIGIAQTKTRHGQVGRLRLQNAVYEYRQHVAVPPHCEVVPFIEGEQIRRAVRSAPWNPGCGRVVVADKSLEMPIGVDAQTDDGAARGLTGSHPALRDLHEHVRILWHRNLDPQANRPGDGFQARTMGYDQAASRTGEIQRPSEARVGNQAHLARDLSAVVRAGRISCQRPTPIAELPPAHQPGPGFLALQAEDHVFGLCPGLEQSAEAVGIFACLDGLVALWLGDVGIAVVVHPADRARVDWLRIGLVSALGIVEGAQAVFHADAGRVRIAFITPWFAPHPGLGHKTRG